MVTTEDGSKVSLTEWFDIDSWMQLLNGLTKDPPHLGRYGLPQPRQIGLALGNLTPDSLERVNAKVDEMRGASLLQGELANWWVTLAAEVEAKLDGAGGTAKSPVSGSDAASHVSGDVGVSEGQGQGDAFAALTRIDELANILGLSEGADGTFVIPDQWAAPDSLLKAVDDARSSVERMKSEVGRDLEQMRMEARDFMSRQSEEIMSSNQKKIEAFIQERLYQFITAAVNAERKAEGAAATAEQAKAEVKKMEQDVQVKVDKRATSVATSFAIGISVVAFLLSVVLGFAAILDIRGG